MKKEKSLTHKFLPILFIVVILFTFISTNSFASDISNNFTSYTGNFPNDLKSLPEYQSGKYFYYAFSVSTVNYVIFIEKASNPLCYLEGSYLVFNDTYNTIGYTFSYSGTINLSSRYTNTISRQLFNRSDNNNKPYFASNSTIYMDNTCTNVFFYPTLLETVDQIPMGMMTALRTIIPIGLVILSMVLVIYLIKSVILQAR